MWSKIDNHYLLLDENRNEPDYRCLRLLSTVIVVVVVVFIVVVVGVVVLVVFVVVVAFMGKKDFIA